MQQSEHLLPHWPLEGKGLHQRPCSKQNFSRCRAIVFSYLYRKNQNMDLGQVYQCGTRLHTPEKKAGNWAGPTPIQSKRIHRSKLTVQQANWPTWKIISSPGRISGKWKEADSELWCPFNKTKPSREEKVLCVLSTKLQQFWGISLISCNTSLSQGLYTWRLELPAMRSLVQCLNCQA